MALVDRTNVIMNKENIMTPNSKQIGLELERKMQKPMVSDVESIKAAVSSLYFSSYVTFLSKASWYLKELDSQASL